MTNDETFEMANEGVKVVLATLNAVSIVRFGYHWQLEDQETLVIVLKAMLKALRKERDAR